MNKLVVGNKNCTHCTFVDIAITMAKEPGSSILFKNWATLAVGVLTPQVLVDKLKQDLLLRTTTILEVTVDILTEWRSRMADEAKLTVLLDILEDICEWKDMADKLHAKFKMTVDNKTCWADLDKRTQHEIMERQVEFLGVRKSLKDILGCLEDSHQNLVLNDYVRVELILELLQPGDFILAMDTLPGKPDIYIQRTISSRRNVDLQILQTKCPDIFVIQNIGTITLSELTGNEHVDKSSRQVRRLTVRYITLDFPEDFELICRHAKHNSVHLLDFKETHLIWLRTFGNLHQIKAHLAAEIECIPESEFLNTVSQNEETPPICIADTPGMGKSLLLASLCQQRKTQATSKVIIFLKFTDLFPQSTLASNYKSPAIKTILERIIDKISLNELGRNILFQMLQFHSIELFIDGFDEIPMPQLQIATDELKKLTTDAKGIKIVATTRLHQQELLERALGTLSFNVSPFHEKDQRDFLEQFWCRKLGTALNPNLQNFTSMLVSEVRSNIRSKDGDIAGIPQQCAMLAEIYQNDAKKYANAKNLKCAISVHVKSIHDMFEKLLKLRFEQIQIESTRHLVKTGHQMAALKLLFPESLELFPKISEIMTVLPSLVEELKKIGLLVARNICCDGDNYKLKFDFLHRTYAEFIVADVFAKSLHSSLDGNGFQDFLFSNILHLTDYDGGIRFNTFAFECRPKDVYQTLSEHPTANEYRERWVELARCLNLGSAAILEISSSVKPKPEWGKPFELDSLWWILIRWSEGFSKQPLFSELVDALISIGFVGVAETLKSKNYRKTFYNTIVCFFLDKFLPEYTFTFKTFALNSPSFLQYHELLQSCIFLDFINLFQLISKCCLSFKEQQSYEANLEGKSWPNLILDATKHSSKHLLEECCKFVELIEGMPLHQIKFFWKWRGSWEFTPVHAACQRGDVPVFVYLRKKFEKRISEMNGLLHVCTERSFGYAEEVISGKIEIMQALLKTKPALLEEEEPWYNATPIVMTRVDFRLLEFLIEKGANPRALDVHLRSVLSRAAISFSPDDLHRLMELLVGKNCGEFFISRSHYQFFHLLQSAEIKQKTLVLLGPQLKMHFKIHKDSMELFCALMGPQRNSVWETLVQYGANPKGTTSDGSSVLHIAAGYGKVEAIEYFCSLGLKVNARDSHKQTPLHVAVILGTRNLNEMVMTLLERGADATIVDEFGKTALWYAENEEDIRKLNPMTLEALQDASKPKSSSRKNLFRFCT